MSSAWRQRPLGILGATGSVGHSALAVAEHLQIPVYGVAAGSNAQALAAAARRAKAQVAVIHQESALPALKAALAGSGIRCEGGETALCALAADERAPCIVSAIVGGAGLGPGLAALRAGKRLCTANKEPLVMAGHLMQATARKHGGSIYPVDSEHAALFACLQGRDPAQVEELILTGSGGPFRTRQNLHSVTVQEALCHPVWSMGAKITIDSATLMNKALEIIEARWLFAVPVERLRVVIHPQGLVHGLVRLRDGALLAHCASADMRIPLQQAITWPDCAVGSSAPLDLLSKAWEFFPPDTQRFPALNLGFWAAQVGGLVPVALNAANEVAVAAFRAGRIAFPRIWELAAAAMDRVPGGGEPDLDSILACDSDLRGWASEQL